MPKPTWYSCRVRSAVRLSTFLLLAGLMGCASRPMVHVDAASLPQTGALRAFDKERPMVALVLSGGSARGYAHIGVIRVLEQLGIEPDLIVGTSAGSIVGAGYAAGLSADQLNLAAIRLETATLMDLTLPQLGQPVLRGDLGLIRVEALPRRLAVVATDLQTGRSIAFTRGNVGLAVRASSAVPGLFVPPSINGRHYIDGQISSPLPVMAARSLGADIVIAVDATYPPQHAVISNLPDVLFQSFMIASQRIKDVELQSADLVIRLNVQTTGQFGFKDREWLITAGEAAARELSSELQRLTSGAKAERTLP
jgi:NTE family protein